MIKTRINKVTEIEYGISEIDLTFLNQSSRFIMPISANEVTDITPDCITRPVVNYLSRPSPVTVIDRVDDTTIFTYKFDKLQLILNADNIKQFEKLLKHDNAFMGMIPKADINFYVGINYYRNLTINQQERQEITHWSYYQVTDIVSNILTYE